MYSLCKLNELKGWEQEQDLGAFGNKIIFYIKKERLFWNSGVKVEEMVFGIKKVINLLFYDFFHVYLHIKDVYFNYIYYI